MKLDVLKKLAKSVKKSDESQGNYAGMGAGASGNGKSDDATPYIPSIEFAEKK